MLSPQRKRLILHLLREHLKFERLAQGCKQYDVQLDKQPNLLAPVIRLMGYSYDNTSNGITLAFIQSYAQVSDRLHSPKPNIEALAQERLELLLKAHAS